MPLEFDKKFIAAALLFVLIIFSSVAVFFFVGKGKEPVALLDEAVEKEGLVSDDGNRQKAELEPEAKVELVFAGDLMLDRYISTVIDSKGFDHILQDLRTVLANADLVIANLEGPITEYESKSIGSEMASRENYIFTFPVESARWLKQSNISIVNIGNNHIMNFGDDGLRQTRAALAAAGVKYFGDPENADYRWYVKEINGKKIGFVSFNQFIADGDQKAFEDLGKAKEKADIAVVFAHWGTEYETKANEMQKGLARKFIDQGADLVVGSHPHVVQEMEEYNGKRIYYSLGNFIFDQYFSEETKSGLLLKVRIGKKIEFFEELEIRLESNGQTTLKR